VRLGVASNLKEGMAGRRDGAGEVGQERWGRRSVAEVCV